MVPLADLWLPILISGVLVFVVSSVIHMAIPLHRGDFAKLPGEDAIRSALRGQGVSRGSYMFPFCGSMKAMGTEEHLAKLREGPVGILTILPNGPPAMGKYLVQWFLFGLLVSAICGYLTGITTAPGAEYMDVFRRAGTAAFLGFAVYPLSESIWKGVRWGVSLKFVIDGTLYALAVAGVFGWLWPDATP